MKRDRRACSPHLLRAFPIHKQPRSTSARDGRRPSAGPATRRCSLRSRQATDPDAARHSKTGVCSEHFRRGEISRSGEVDVFPLTRSSRGGSSFLACPKKDAKNASKKATPPWQSPSYLSFGSRHIADNRACKACGPAPPPATDAILATLGCDRAGAEPVPLEIRPQPVAPP